MNLTEVTMVRCTKLWSAMFALLIALTGIAAPLAAQDPAPICGCQVHQQERGGETVVAVTWWRQVAYSDTLVWEAMAFDTVPANTAGLTTRHGYYTVREPRVTYLQVPCAWAQRSAYWANVARERARHGGGDSGIRSRLRWWGEGQINVSTWWPTGKNVDREGNDPIEIEGTIGLYLGDGYSAVARVLDRQYVGGPYDTDHDNDLHALVGAHKHFRTRTEAWLMAGYGAANHRGEDPTTGEIDPHAHKGVIAFGQVRQWAGPVFIEGNGITGFTPNSYPPEVNGRLGVVIDIKGMRFGVHAVAGHTWPAFNHAQGAFRVGGGISMMLNRPRGTDSWDHYYYGRSR